MTKQKIMIKVSLPDEKSRSKAMVLAAEADGVISMGITGDDKDRLEVVGENVDSACLVKRLRKKLCRHAGILQVEEVKEKKKAEEPEVKEKKKAEEPKILHPPPCRCPPPPMVIYDEPSFCSIM
ncbi:heavy metal-associated isoprenylated plant protein 47-like isoform X2 [Phragmites australis]|uniref:heavy metal-associated isoprenylated plant protein 47-like isoform X2 n=1 Tax=Phragmites australis TaxID=29695 RepID=UPI002D79BA27|nr:heavy metal-associated isoprenylated plant protein 47-like isoform X2 [Phragmites australis]